MAYDKVVDSSVLDAGLKQIADAIRAKGGTSDNLAFPTAMADAIAAIKAGGGDDTYRIEKGTFTVASGELSYNLFSPDTLKEITGRRVQYFLMIDGFSDDVAGNVKKFAYAACTGYIDIITSTVCTVNTPAYYMARNNSGTLSYTASSNPFSASAKIGITIKAISTYGFGTQEYKWIMVMRDD